MATNNTHIAITSGQYVYIQDNSTMPEGLYRATANIAANATLSGSNVTAVSGGGLNALNSNLSNYTQADGTVKTLTDTDANSAKTTGIYFVSNASNVPTASKYGYLEVIARNSNYVKQIWNSYGSTDEYIRICDNGTWGEWISLSSNKSDRTKITWGTSLTVNIPHAMVMFSSSGYIIVWLNGSTGIDVTVYPIGLTPYRKQSSTGTVKFGFNGNTDESSTATRSGSSFTITTSIDYTMTALG
ncbi:MAG: hypothetical protein J6S83_12150 [Lachnospiraceae bacterium]|nr:hypothetical protein [Lachnospiraceae bacterium]